ncbi:MAG: SoxY-related AACIE arm protein [Burkholderiales bacterium]|jgi:sulfur-oxidizing protein SoxY
MNDPSMPADRSRRQWLAAGFGVSLWVAWRPALALSDELAGALRGFTGGAATREGKVNFDIAPLVENGNTVPITVTVDNPMTADNHVQAIAVFNEKNPQRDVVACRLTPRSGRAVVSTRIRLATTQQLVAVAKLSDGSYWTHTVDVVVTLAACIE